MAKKKAMEFEDEVVDTEVKEEKATKKKSIKKEVAPAGPDVSISSVMKQPPAEVIKPMDITCISCGEVFTMYPAEQKLYKARGYELPKRCPKCRAEKHSVTKAVCVDCGAEFDIRNAEMEYFKANNLQMPKRCPQCRSFKRERNNRQ